MYECQIYTASDEQVLEGELNRFFLRISDLEIVSINFSQSEDEHRIHYTALIVYKLLKGKNL